MKVDRFVFSRVGGLCLALWIALVTPAQAQKEGSGALEHWKRLPPERQLELKQRFEDFRALDPEARRLLIERAQQWRGELERLPEQATADQTMRWLKLPQELRRQVLGDYLRANARFRQPGPGDMLPPDLRGDLQRLAAGHRPLIFDRARKQAQTHIGEQALERFGTRLGLSPERVEQLRALPPFERAAALREHLSRWPELDLPPAVRQFLERRLHPDGTPLPPDPLKGARGGSGAPGIDSAPPPFPHGADQSAPQRAPDADRPPPAGAQGLDLPPHEGPVGPGQRPPPFPPIVADRMLEVLAPELEDFLLAAENGRRLTPPELEQLQRQRLLAAFSRLGDVPTQFQRDLRNAPLHELIQRARAGLDQPRRPRDWFGERPPRPPR
jgi:Protein of unknown function (DUF3106)